MARIAGAYSLLVFLLLQLPSLFSNHAIDVTQFVEAGKPRCSQLWFEYGNILGRLVTLQPVLVPATEAFIYNSAAKSREAFRNLVEEVMQVCKFITSITVRG